MSKEITLKLVKKIEAETEEGTKHSFLYIPVAEEDQKDLALVIKTTGIQNRLGLPDMLFDEVTIHIGKKKEQTLLDNIDKNVPTQETMDPDLETKTKKKKSKKKNE